MVDQIFRPWADIRRQPCQNFIWLLQVKTPVECYFLEKIILWKNFRYLIMFFAAMISKMNSTYAEVR